MKKLFQLLVALSFLSLAPLKIVAGEDQQTVWTSYGSVTADVGFPYQYEGSYYMTVTISNGSNVNIVVEFEYASTRKTIITNSGSYNIDINNMGDWATIGVDGLPPGYYTVTAFAPTYFSPNVNAWGW